MQFIVDDDPMVLLAAVLACGALGTGDGSVVESGCRPNIESFYTVNFIGVTFQIHVFPTARIIPRNGLSG